jgi:hypothetical protein
VRRGKIARAWASRRRARAGATSAVEETSHSMATVAVRDGETARRRISLDSNTPAATATTALEFIALQIEIHVWRQILQGETFSSPPVSEQIKASPVILRKGVCLVRRLPGICKGQGKLYRLKCGMLQGRRPICCPSGGFWLELVTYRSNAASPVND